MNGKGGNNHRGWRRRERDGDYWAREGKKKTGPQYDKNRGVIYDRPKWTPPKLSSEPIPLPDCLYCGRPIKDISSALSDKASGEAVHFDCVIAKIAEAEHLDRGDAVTYIGGGRFGIVHYNNPSDQGTRNFQIKKILEWEDKEHRAEWRKTIADHFSVT
jgi:hypothetical protein